MNETTHRALCLTYTKSSINITHYYYYKTIPSLQAYLLPL